MKVMHIESGLGNQMLDYCDLLAERYTNPDAKIYIENIIYDIKEAHSTICMWNGYELEKVFGICEKNVKILFNESQWNQILEAVKKSRFWEDNWTYSDAICDAFAMQGLKLNNIHRRPHLSEKREKSGDFGKSFIGYNIKRRAYKLLKDYVVKNQNLFIESFEDDFTGHTLSFCMKKSGIEKIDTQIRNSFVFPNFTEDYNINMLDIIKNVNSVAIHARRGDMLSANEHYYKYGYFKRAVNFIKKNVPNPVFFFFCDFGSIEWVQKNYNIFGLIPDRDKIYFVTGNKGEKSFRDMQLMTHCKHAIITNSSFGFWGAYLNTNPNKITCSPDIRINTTHTF